jgi:hypothetical protein
MEWWKFWSLEIENHFDIIGKTKRTPKKRSRRGLAEGAYNHGGNRKVEHFQ